MQGAILNFSELFGQSAQPAATRIPEAAVADLRILFDEYRAFLEACPFKPGDLVTPKVGYGVKGAGEPHIVVEVDRPFLSTHGETGSSIFGKRLDMRVAQYAGEQRFLFWVESFTFEPWKAAEPGLGEVEGSFRLPDSYDPADIDDVKMAVLTHLGAGEAHFGTIIAAIEAGTIGLADALRELVYAGDVAHRRGDDGRDYYRLILEGEAA